MTNKDALKTESELRIRIKGDAATKTLIIEGAPMPERTTAPDL